MTTLRDKYLLNILSWKTQSYFDGTLRSTKVLNMEFKELPDWFDISLVDQKHVVQPTPKMMKFIGFANDVIGVEHELISISLIEKEKANSMWKTAEDLELSESDCSCGCEHHDDDEE